MIPASINHRLMDQGLSIPSVDFTGFTEVDPAGDLTLATASVTFGTLTRSTTTYAYKDYKPNAFGGNFTIDFDFRLSSATSGGFVDLVTLNNALSEAGSSSNYLKCGFANFGGAYRLRLIEESGGVFLDEYVMPNLNRLYCRFVRDESVGTYGTAYLYIATSSANRNTETWVDTLTITLKSFQDFRYMQVSTSLNDSNSGVVSGDVSNMSIDAN